MCKNHKRCVTTDNWIPMPYSAIQYSVFVAFLLLVFLLPSSISSVPQFGIQVGNQESIKVKTIKMGTTATNFKGESYDPKVYNCLGKKPATVNSPN